MTTNTCPNCNRKVKNNFVLTINNDCIGILCFSCAASLNTAKNTTLETNFFSINQLLEPEKESHR